MSKYRVINTEKNCIEISAPIKTVLTYRIPYKHIRNRDYDKEISNRFIVYILLGKNNKGKDIIYVGKSKNGLDNRPGCHEDKYKNWTDCYILTDIKERTILNDGTIQYIENQINERINEIDKFLNQTNQTIRDTANRSDMEDCDIFLENAYEMLNILGLDLLPQNIDEQEEDKVKDLEKKIKEFPNNLIPIKKETEDLIKSVIPDIIIEPKAVYYSYLYGKKAICTISCTSKNLRMVFNIPAGEMNDPNNLLEDVSEKGKHGVGNYRFTFHDKSRFDDIKDFLEQTINYEKERLGE